MGSSPFYGRYGQTTRETIDQGSRVEYSNPSRIASSIVPSPLREASLGCRMFQGHRLQG